MEPTSPAARYLAEAQSRRDRAATLFEAGVRQAEISRRLGVTESAVSLWHTAWKKRGRAGLKVSDRFGRPSWLTDEQKERLQRALFEGADSHGFGTDLWTLPRITELIARLFDVRYHPGHVW